MIERELLSVIKNRAKKYPIVTLTGPRQSGKTTLVKKAFPQKPYVNLEIPETRKLATSDPKHFLSQYPKGAIIDEIQRVPDLTSYLQAIVDEKRKNNLFVLTGSQNFRLIESVSQSLAGRTALLELCPFSLSEIKEKIKKLSLDQILLKGFYPRIYDQKIEPAVYLRDYFRTYVERDVRLIENIRNLSLFEKFVRLCAGRVGQIINRSNLANEVGVSSTTIEEWLSLLKASYIIFLLPPHFRNYNKRIIKSPKLYFYDVGLASYLLEIESARQLAHDPRRGALFENLVISEVLKYQLNRGNEIRFGYFRDSTGNEIDLIIRVQGELIAWEIKSAATYSSDFMKGLDYFKKIAKDPIQKTQIIYGGNQEHTVGSHQIISYKKMNPWLVSFFKNY